MIRTAVTRLSLVFDDTLQPRYCTKNQHPCWALLNVQLPLLVCCLLHFDLLSLQASLDSDEIGIMYDGTDPA